MDVHGDEGFLFVDVFDGIVFFWRGGWELEAVPVSAWSRRGERWVRESSEKEAPLLSPTEHSDDAHGWHCEYDSTDGHVA